MLPRWDSNSFGFAFIALTSCRSPGVRFGRRSTQSVYSRTDENGGTAYPLNSGASVALKSVPPP